MNDMRATIIPKSDQINADDLIGGPITIAVSSVAIRPGTEQPVSIAFDGDNGKPYKPCKSMCKVMVHLWGPDANAYVGRSMTLYRDPKVLWGGMAVGGIRISHLSHIESAQTMMLTESKKARKPFVVKPLAVDAPKTPTQEAKPKITPMEWFTGRIASLESREQCAALFAEGTKARALLDQQSEEDRGAVYDMLSEKRASFLAGPTPPDDDTFPGDLPSEASA